MKGSMRALLTVLFVAALCAVGCENWQVKPEMTEHGPAVTLVVGAETAEKLNSGMDNLEELAVTTKKLAAGFETLAAVVGTLSDNKEIDDAAEKTGDAARKVGGGAAGLLALLTIIKGAMREEDDNG